MYAEAWLAIACHAITLPPKMQQFAGVTRCVVIMLSQVQVELWPAIGPPHRVSHVTCVAVSCCDVPCRRFAAHLARYPDVFKVSEQLGPAGCITLAPSLATPEARTQAVAGALARRCGGAVL